jgi:hypothetical protein
VDEKERDEMVMRTTCRIQAGMRNQGYDLPDRVRKIPYRCKNTPDMNLYLLYPGW